MSDRRTTFCRENEDRVLRYGPSDRGARISASRRSRGGQRDVEAMGRAVDAKIEKGEAARSARCD